MKLFKWIAMKLTEKSRLRNQLGIARMECEDLHRTLAARRRPQLRVVPEKALPQREVVGALGVTNDTVWLRAVHQVVDEAIGDCVEALPAAQGEKRIELAGAIGALRDLQATLLDRQAVGLKADPEADGMEGDAT